MEDFHLPVQAPLRRKAFLKSSSLPLWQNTIFFKFSSLSAPTKIEELTAGSDEKNVGAEREENLIRNDPDKSELTNFFVSY